MRNATVFLAICFFAAGAELPRAATTTVALSLKGDGSAAPAAYGGLSLTFSGVGMASPLGQVTFTGTGQVADFASITATTPITGALTLAFSTADKVNTTFSVPAGFFIPALGQVTTASGSLTITGGTGQYAGATGSFPSLTGSGISTGLTTASFQLQGNGTMVTAAPAGPAISPNGVVTATAYGAYKDISPGTWIEIYGTNLSATTRSWGGADFTNGGQNAPTALDGVKVTVGGQAAFVAYISPGQVNALVPSNAAVGPAQLTLTNLLGTTAPTSLMIKTIAPGLLAPTSFQFSGKQYVGALLANTQTFSGIPANPAKPGDVLTIFGIGFGPVTPAVNAGTLSSQLTSLTTKPQFMFGTTPAELTYYGLAPGFTALYQFNVVVPAVPSNSAVPLTLNLGGVGGAQTLYIAVQQP